MVVNVRNAAYDVLVDRTTRWGNPFTHIKDRKTRAEHVVASREEAIQRYEEWLKTQSDLLRDLPLLRGKVLGCWCAPQSCHAEVLVRLANEEAHDEG
jgi:hypothetical protein